MQRKIYLATALVAALSLPVVAYGQTTPEQRQAILNAHNVKRALHCVPQLQGSDLLAANAQTWADGCHKDASGTFFTHQPSNPNGENLAWGYRTFNGVAILPGLSPEQVVENWYGEINNYDFNNPFLKVVGNIGINGHFTQVVWRASTLLGCAQATCPIPIGGGATETGTLWVCEYSPQGNFNANPQNLTLNVPRLCN
jgi:uncharacterized protein YkwD